jgi:CheY-like chemotaxis protein
LLVEEHSFDSYFVLLVDDNPANVFIAEQYLNQWNVKYRSAESGSQALKLLRENRFDLILLDLQMPLMDGYETAKRARELPLDKNPIIVAFSASTKGEVSKQLEEASIDDHLPKPFQPKELYEMLLRYHNESHQNSKKSTASEVKNTKKKPKVKNKLQPGIKNKQSFSLARFEKMANNKPEYLKKFKLSTLDALISYQNDFDKAITERKAKILSDLIHKSTMSLYYIQADPLSDLLKECRFILETDSGNEELLYTKSNACNDEFHIIMKGLREK